MPRSWQQRMKAETKKMAAIFNQSWLQIVLDLFYHVHVSVSGLYIVDHLLTLK